MKDIFFQEISREGLDNLGDTVEVMAESEGLEAHRAAVCVRREYRSGGKREVL